MLGRVLLLCPLAMMAVAIQAQTAAPAYCPWATQGSAAKLLGGEVTVTVTLSEGGAGSCSFTRLQGPEASLKIDVSKSALPSCGAEGVRLRGIGNEAMRCRAAANGGSDGETISGRVRDLHFTLTLILHPRQQPPNSADPQNDGFEQIAEQVAGNLF
jgi:hypothetical protein